MSLNCKLIAISLVSLHEFNVFQKTRLNKAYFLRKTYWLGSTTSKTIDYALESGVQLIFGEPVVNDFQQYVDDPINAN